MYNYDSTSTQAAGVGNIEFKASLGYTARLYLNKMKHSEKR